MVERLEDQEKAPKRLLKLQSFDDLVEITLACKDTIDRKLKIKAKQQKFVDQSEEHNRVLDEYEEILQHILAEVGRQKYLDVIMGIGNNKTSILREVQEMQEQLKN